MAIGTDMDTAWLEDFLVLADCLNFSRAAEQRHMTQSAMSRRIQSLEEWLAVPLFSRETHRLSLTPAGEQFKPAAFDMVRRLAAARDEARDTAELSGSALRFASTHALSLTFFPAWLGQMEDHGALGPVRLTADTMQACERLMLHGQAQFLLCHHHPAASMALAPREFRSLLLGQDTLLPVSAPANAGAHPHEPLHRLPGTQQQPVASVSYGDTSGLGRILAAVRAQDGPLCWLESGFTSHGATVLRAMAREGRGVAFVPLSLVSEDLTSGRLVRAGDTSWDIPVEIRLFRPQARQNPAAEQFWSRLQAAADGDDASSA
jgi:DNA-binding transcriptional LysR family regulator